MNIIISMGTVVKTIALGLALTGLFSGAVDMVEAREFKTVKVKAITPSDFAEGCAMEGGILNEKHDNDGNLVESSCTEMDGSGADCDWSTNECRVYPPNMYPAPATPGASGNASATGNLDGTVKEAERGSTRKPGRANVKVMTTPVASR